MLILYVGVIGGIACSMLLGAYLLASVLLTGRHWNEAFSSLRIEDYKCFLRMHIGRDGTLTVYALGIDRVCRRWVADPDGAPDASWLKPEQDLTVRLIEEPIQVAGPQATRL